MKKLLFFLFMLIGFTSVFSSCMGPEEIPKPKNLIDENNYVDLMLEMQHIKTYRDAYPDSVSADSLKSIVFNRFGVTEEQFLSSHTYYEKQTKSQITRVNEVLKRLKEEEQYIQAHIDSVKSSQQELKPDTVSIK